MGLSIKNNLAALAASVALVSIASAETSTKPTDRVGDATEVSSPYWNPQGGGASQAMPPQFGERLMEVTVLAVPQARADAVAAKWQYRRANNVLNVSADNMRRDFNESEEYAAAVNEFKQAYRELENARIDALKGLRTSADYEAIETMRKSVNEQIADERDQDKPSADRLQALAELKMQSIAPIRAAEQSVIENSSAVRSARTRLIEAATKVARIERDFAHEVRDSIELADARNAKEDARIAMLASAAYLDEARTARDIAVRYTYLARGLNRPYGNGFSPYGSYGSSGYSYGYGYGYGGYGGVAYGFPGVGGPVGYTGNTGFGRGSNAFTGRSGNSFIGSGPSSSRQSGALNPPGSNSPGQPFGPNAGATPSPFGPNNAPSPFGPSR